MTTRSTKDKTSDEIRLALANRGFTFASVDRENDLPDGSARFAAKWPNEAGEHAISAVLEIAAAKIWPSRYDETGERLKPQPSKNYRYEARFGQRLKRRAA